MNSINKKRPERGGGAVPKSQERLLRLSEILGQNGILPISKSQWYLGIQNGLFPKPTKLGERISAWKKSDIDALVENGVNFDTPAPSNDGGCNE